MSSSLVAGVVTFFAGSAGVVGLGLLVYAIAYAADRVPCLQNGVLTAEEVESRRNASTLTIKAGLAGLLKDERDKVYRTFFERQAFPYEKATKEDETCTEKIKDAEEDIDLEAQTDAKTEDPDVAGERDDVMEQSATVKEDVLDEKKTHDDPLDTMQAAETGYEDLNEPSCSICLNVYANGDKVILGTDCSHMFHYDCCMQWVEKGNEHCPYCRKTMISPQDYYHTAADVLGSERVAKLKRINESAATRVAALSAAGQSSIPYPIPPTSQRPLQHANNAEAEEANAASTGVPATAPTPQNNAVDDSTDVSSSPESPSILTRDIDEEAPLTTEEGPTTSSVSDGQQEEGPPTATH